MGRQNNLRVGVRVSEGEERLLERLCDDLSLKKSAVMRAGLYALAGIMYGRFEPFRENVIVAQEKKRRFQETNEGGEPMLETN